MASWKAFKEDGATLFADQDIADDEGDVDDEPDEAEPALAMGTQAKSINFGQGMQGIAYPTSDDPWRPPPTFPVLQLDEPAKAKLKDSTRKVEEMLADFLLEAEDGDLGEVGMEFLSKQRAELEESRRQEEERLAAEERARVLSSRPAEPEVPSEPLANELEYDVLPAGDGPYDVRQLTSITSLDDCLGIAVPAFSTRTNPQYMTQKRLLDSLDSCISIALPVYNRRRDEVVTRQPTGPAPAPAPAPASAPALVLAPTPDWLAPPVPPVSTMVESQEMDETQPAPREATTTSNGSNSQTLITAPNIPKQIEVAKRAAAPALSLRPTRSVMFSSE